MKQPEDGVNIDCQYSIQQVGMGILVLLRGFRFRGKTTNEVKYELCQLC